jgi:photosystem II stability/assembly factor-like uncharacterized protein
MKKHYFTILAILAFTSTIFSQTASWSVLTSGTTANLLGVSATSATECWVVGSSGTILKTVNGGTNWSPQISGTTEILYSVYFTSSNNGYAVGDNGIALRTINGGTTWTTMTVPVSSAVDFRSVYFIDNNTGFITGGISGSSSSILKTTNGGSSWTSLPTSSVSSTGIYDITFTSPTDGYATDFNGKILKTTNGGTSWSSLVSGTTGSLLTIYFTSVNNGLVSGASGMIRSTSDAGSTWSGITSGTTDYLTGVDFYNSTNGVYVGGNTTANTGIILTTTNGGTSWSSYSTGTARLYAIDFFNANAGFAAGLNGVIMKYASNVGINEPTSGSSQLINYPNPFSTTSTIELGSYRQEEMISVELYDLSGKLIIIKDYEVGVPIIVDQKDITSGIYIYKVLDGKKFIGSGKMTIQ